MARKIKKIIRTLTFVTFLFSGNTSFTQNIYFAFILYIPISQFLSKGKLEIPAVWDAKKATINGELLLLHKPKLEALYKKLKIKQPTL